MASSSSSINLSNPAHFFRMEKFADSLLPVGEFSEDGSPPKLCLGHFLKSEVLGKEVPYTYLLTDPHPALFCPGFVKAHNWGDTKGVYGFPITRKGVKLVEWYQRLSQHLGEKWNNLDIHSLIRLSILPMQINLDVCAALLACWNSSLNCFYFPEGPLTITLEDLFFITGCSPFGKQLRFIRTQEDRFEFDDHRISRTVARYESLALDYKPSLKEEFDFYLEWLSKFIFYNRGKQATGYMVALSNHLCQAKDLQAFDPFLLDLLYRGMWEASFKVKVFPSCPAGGLCGSFIFGPFYTSRVWFQHIRASQFFLLKANWHPFA